MEKAVVWRYLYLFENICMEIFVLKYVYGNVCMEVFVKRYLYGNICMEISAVRVVKSGNICNCFTALELVLTRLRKS